MLGKIFELGTCKLPGKFGNLAGFLEPGRVLSERPIAVVMNNLKIPLFADDDSRKYGESPIKRHLKASPDPVGPLKAP